MGGRRVLVVAMRGVVAFALIVPGCQRVAVGTVSPIAVGQADPEPDGGEPEWSRIRIDADLDGPARLRMTPAIALGLGRAEYGGKQPRPDFDVVREFPTQLRCPRDTMCTFVVDKTLGAVVFAFDQVVEIEVVPASGQRRSATVRYRDPTSVSAALGRIYEHHTDLEMACLDGSLQRAERLARARPLEEALRGIVEEDERGLVKRAASLALVQGQCTESEANRVVAQRLLETLAPNAPEIAPWADAVPRLGPLANEPERGAALLEAVIDQHPRVAVGARLLYWRLHDLPDDADPRIRADLQERLRDPRFAGTPGAELAEQARRKRDAVRLGPGDPIGPLALRKVGGGQVDANGTPAGPRLVYFSASWCRACIDALPKLRRLADAHPEIRVVYVLWDGPDDARDFVVAQAPIPGEVAWTDLETRDRVQAVVFRYVALPSFVLAGRDGVVLATSDETTLDDLDGLLPVAGGTGS